jgi:hypothetical protein
VAKAPVALAQSMPRNSMLAVGMLVQTVHGVWAVDGLPSTTSASVSAAGRWAVPMHLRPPRPAIVLHFRTWHVRHVMC